MDLIEVILVLLINTVPLTSATAVSLPTKINGGLTSADALHEICNLETFRPQCWRNEVIVIGRAYYGRRHTGRCLNVEDSQLVQNPRYLGCSADVTDLLAAKCSGKKQCEIRVPDLDLEQTKPCLNDLKLFLEVSYTCVEVIEDRSCVISITSNPLHIARPSASSSSSASSDVAAGQLQQHCGTRNQPWLIEAPSGQKIKISLLDFTPSAAASSAGLISESKSRDLVRTSQGKSGSGSAVGSNSGVGNMYSCQYGYVVDRSLTTSNKRNVSVCGGGPSQQLTNVYTSASNEVELVLPQNDQLNFLLRMQAIGCTDLVPPEDAWVQRVDDRIVIGCFTSRHTWQLRCQDGKWMGVMSNCSQFESFTMMRLDAVIHDDSSPTHIKNYEVATVVAICFLCLVMSLLIICGGAVCWYRFYANISPGSLGVYRFKYRCVGLPKAGGYSPRDIEMSMVETSTNRYENLIYGSAPAAPPSGGEAKTKLTPALIKLFGKTGDASAMVAGS